MPDLAPSRTSRQTRRAGGSAGAARWRLGGRGGSGYDEPWPRHPHPTPCFGAAPMYEPTEVIAEFPTETEAQVALARLRAEGIEGAISGEVPHAASFSLLGRLQYAPILLSVAASQVDKARQILAQDRDAALEEGWEDAAEAAIQGWICPNCDTEVMPEETTCPECGASRPDLGADEEHE